MQREEWFAALSSGIVDAVPGQARAAVRAVAAGMGVGGLGDLVPALLISDVARRYADAWHPDDIAAWVSTLVDAPEEPSALDAVVLPVCDLYRSNELPFRRWWRPDQVSRMLLGWYARRRLADTDVDDVLADLVRRWSVDDPEAGADLVVGAMEDPVPPPDTFTAAPRDPAQRWLQKVARLAKVRREIDAALEGYDPVVAERDDLSVLLRHMLTHRAIAAQLPADYGWRDPVVDKAVAQMEAAAVQCGAFVATLTPYERSLLVPVSDDDRTLEEAMGIHRRTISVDRYGPNALPDRVGGGWRTTDWLQDYVFNVGGRVLRRSAGPMAHWTLVLEHGMAAGVVGLFDEDTPFRLALRRGEEAVALELLLPDDPEDPLRAQFSYDTAAPAAMLDLAVLVETGRARLDVFALNDEGRLVGIGTRLIPLPAQIVDALRPIAARGVRPAIEDVRGIYVRSDAEQQALSRDAFLSVEWTKSQSLLAAVDAASLVPGRPPTPASVAAATSAREVLLDLRIKHAERRHADPDAGEQASSELRSFQEQVLEAEQRYENAVALMRGTARDERAADGPAVSSEARLRKLVGGLVGTTTALLHLAVTRSALDGSDQLTARAAVGSGRTLRVVELDDSRVPLDALRTHMSGPLAGPEEFDAMLVAAPDLGRMIAEPLLERGVRRLIISPVWFLHAVPIHCWPATAGGGLLLDAFDSVSYAPSAAVLQRLRTRRRRGSSVAALSHGADLRFAGAEGRVLAALREGDEVFAGSLRAPTPRLSRAGRLRSPDPGVVRTPPTTQTLRAAAADGGLLHVACHGRWFVDDYWDSGIELAGGLGSSHWLSVGEVQRDLDLNRVELVNLSACESGVSTGLSWSVDRYAGIDGAFLAAGARTVVSTLWPVADVAAFLFSAAFYRALADGRPVWGAYHDAVSLLRTGEYRAIDGSHPLGAHIEAAGVDWPREVRELDRDGIDLTHPFFWGVFKLGGLVDAPVDALAPRRSS
jgi:CHAT domain-containing protein/CBS domain-containing protein